MGCIELSAIERHGNKAAEVKRDRYGQRLYVTWGSDTWQNVDLDEELIDMVINVCLEFKEKLTESRRRKAA
jgi:hypothetical protein